MAQSIEGFDSPCNPLFEVNQMLGYTLPVWVEFLLFCLSVYVLFRKDKK